MDIEFMEQNEYLIENRKLEHLKICLEKDVTNNKKKSLDDFSFVYRAISDLHYNTINTSTEILKYKIDIPILISSITGATKDMNLNKVFCKIASKAKIPLTLGSFKSLFNSKEKYKNQFCLKNEAPNIPLIANIGLFEFKNHLKDIKEIVKEMQFDAISVHLNTGQELIQINGDRDFTNPYETLEIARDNIDIPIIIKETGFGINPHEIKKLLNIGFDFIDLSCCGTNWMIVEGFSKSKINYNLALPFKDWGYDLGTLLLALNYFLSKKDMKKIIASGNIQNGVDLAKTLVLGAPIGAFASAFLKGVFPKGIENFDKDICFENGIKFLDEVKNQLKITMTLTNCQDIHDLRKKKLLIDKEIKYTARKLLDYE